MVLHFIVLFIALVIFGLRKVIELKTTQSAILRNVKVEMSLLMVTTVSICGEPFIAKYAWIRSFARVNSLVIYQACLVLKEFPAVRIRALMDFVLIVRIEIVYSITIIEIGMLKFVFGGLVLQFVNLG